MECNKLLNEVSEILSESAGKNGLKYRLTKNPDDNTKLAGSVYSSEIIRSKKMTELRKVPIKQLGTINSKKNNKIANRNMGGTQTLFDANAEEAKTIGEKRALSSQKYLHELEDEQKKKREKEKSQGRPQNESVVLSEAISVLVEANGEKGLTTINKEKDPKEVYKYWKNELNTKDRDKVAKAFAKHRIDAMDMLKNATADDLEFVGKEARKDQKKDAKKALRSGGLGIKERILQRHLTDTKPIKDKEEMRKNNIKLGHAILSAQTAPSDYQVKTEKETKDKERREKLAALKERQKKFTKAVNESVDIILSEAIDLINK